jgi:hypothetical protein
MYLGSGGLDEILNLDGILLVILKDDRPGRYLLKGNPNRYGGVLSGATILGFWFSVGFTLTIPC